jgi:hypothetical protein
MLHIVVVISITNPSGHRCRLYGLVEFMLNLTSEIVAVPEKFDCTSGLKLRAIAPASFRYVDNDRM